MIDSKDLLDYEIKSAWWVDWLPNWLPLVTLASRFVVWRTGRKYRRYRHVTIKENERNIQLLR